MIIGFFSTQKCAVASVKARGLTTGAPHLVSAVALLRVAADSAALPLCPRKEGNSGVVGRTPVVGPCGM